MTTRLLIVDDDRSVREALQDALGDEYDLRLAESGEQALELTASSAPDIVLSDVRMPGLDGLALLAMLRARAPLAPVIMMSAYDDPATIGNALRGGAAEFLAKPLDLRAVRNAVTRALGRRRSDEEGSTRATPR